MLRKLIAPILLILLNILVFYGAYIKMQKQGAEPVAMTAAPAPDFTWTDLDNTKHTLKEFSGKVVVLHFWATWCAPCRKEFPRLLSAAKSMGDKVVVLTVSVDDEIKPVQEFIAQAEEKAGTKHLSNVFYTIDKQLAFDLFQTSAFPETIIIDPDQKMRRKYVGGVAWNNSEVMESIKGYGK